MGRGLAFLASFVFQCLLACAMEMELELTNTIHGGDPSDPKVQIAVPSKQDTEKCRRFQQEKLTPITSESFCGLSS